MNKEAMHEPVNLGNPGEFTMKGLAEEVALATGVDLKLCYKPLPQDDPKQRQPDISRAQSRLGWQPTIGLAEGLTATAAYFRSELGT
jgi:UDP-glucuronate decarboxylase